MTYFLVFCSLVILYSLFRLRYPTSLWASARRDIKASPQEIYHYLLELQNFKKWANWLKIDIGDEVSCLHAQQSARIGAWFEWNGKKIGRGRIVTVQTVVNERIDFVVNLNKPFKRYIQTGFLLLDLGNGTTRVNWWVQVKLPALVRFFERSISVHAAKDLQIGLNNLAAEIDPIDADIFHLAYLPPTKLAAIKGLAFRKKGILPEMLGDLEQESQELLDYAKSMSYKAKEMRWIYHKMKPQSMYAEVEVFLGVAEQNPLPSKDYKAKQYPQIYVAGLDFQAQNYSLMPLAWHACLSILKYTRLKKNTRFAPFELYSELEKPPKQARAQICFPLKSR